MPVKEAPAPVLFAITYLTVFAATTYPDRVKPAVGAALRDIITGIPNAAPVIVSVADDELPFAIVPVATLADPSSLL